VADAAGSVVFYVDGAAYPVGAFTTNFTFTTPAAIGAEGDNLESSFFGIIDELSVYNQALSAAEIQSIYGARSSGKCLAPNPIIVSQPTNQTITAYSPASFTVLADGPGTLQYQWTLNGTNVAGATNSTLALTHVLPAQAGNYTVIVGTEPNVTVSSYALLTVNLPPAPTLVTLPTSHIGVVGDWTSFTVAAASQAPVPLSYQWSFDTTNIPGATNSELVLSNLTMASASSYTVAVFNPFNGTNSPPAILTIIPAPTGTNHIVANPDVNELTRAVQAGGSVTFVCDGEIVFPGPIALSRDMVMDGANHALTLAGNYAQLFTIQGAIHVGLRNLTLITGHAAAGGAIYNSNGIVSVSNVVFNGNEAIGPSAYGGAIYNSGGTLNLTNVIFNGNTAQGLRETANGSGSGGAIYNTNGTINMSNVTFLGNAAAGAPVDGDGVVQGSGFGGALASSGGWINGQHIQCTNNSAQGGSGLVYFNYPYGMPYSVASWGQGGAFFVEDSAVVLTNGWFVSNLTGCSSSYNYPPGLSQGGAIYNTGAVLLANVGLYNNSSRGAAGVSGEELDGDQDSDHNGGDAAGGDGGAIYNGAFLEMTNCNFVSNSVTGGTGGAGQSCPICHPPLTGANGQPGNALGGALYNGGQDFVADTQVSNNTATGPGEDVTPVYNSPSSTPASVALAPQIVTVGSQVTFNAMALGLPGLTYQWSWNGTNLANATNATLVLNNVQAAQDGTYSVNIGGYIISATPLLVLTVPSITTNPQNQTVWAGSTASFSVGASGSGPLTYQWNDSLGAIAGATNATLILTNAQPSEADSYSVVVGNPLTTVLSPTATLTVLEPITLEGQWTSGGFNLSGLGISGYNFILEATTNFATWQPLQTNPSPFTFIDTNAAAFPLRFYRAVLAQ